MKEGRAARCIDIEAISPRLWAELEGKLEPLGVKEEYDYLKSIAQAKSMCIGIKRGLLGDLTGEYIWFLAPVFNNDRTQPGNAIALEATTAEGSGKATYFFKICERNQYLNFKNMAEIQIEVDKALRRMNRNLVTINFRREPIYLTEDQLNSPTYVGYRRSIARIPALQELRRQFIGRVIHHSPEQWKADIMQLLVSNMNSG
jgi:hypothetical protein